MKPTDADGSTPGHADPSTSPGLAFPDLSVIRAEALALRRDGWCELVDLGVLRAEGPEATAFLQGQLTQDVAAGVAETGIARPAALLTPKGRMLGSFWLWPQDAQAQTWWLVCSRDLAATLARRLSMFVLRAKVKIVDVSDAMRVVGVIGDVDSASLPSVVATARLTDAAVAGVDEAVRRRLCLVTDTASFDVAQRRDPLDWRRLEILAAQARITQATQDAFVPQMVNFDVTGGVSFTKGCYPGQEIVARAHWLGRQKRRMAVVAGHGEPPAPMTDVFGDGGIEADTGAQATATDAAETSAGTGVQRDAQPLGRVVDAVGLASGAGYVALAEVALPDPAPTTLQIAGRDVAIVPLPYAIPVPAPKRPTV